MNKIVVLLFVACLAASCDDSNDPKENDCETLATIRDFRGLDGCGFVLELADGSILEPQALVSCGADNVMRSEDPFQSIVPEEGKKVKISYTPVENASICMSGQPVKITCISEESLTQEY